jgi:hypothetical protein
MIYFADNNLFKRNFITFGILILTLFFFLSCDYTVDNPGPTPDSRLNQEIALPSVVAGMERAAAEALNWIAYTGGAVSLEINAAGSIGAFGVSTAERRGNLLAGEAGTHWQYSQRARFTAENGIERMRDVLGDEFSSSDLAAEGLLWVGYSNRLLGENFCKAVINGREAQSNDEYFRRAENAFSEALSIAENIGNSRLTTAALAGRAQINVNQGDWSDAISDAQQVPADFEYKMQYYDQTEVQRNRISFANSNEPYRAHTVADTYYGPDVTDSYGGIGDLSFSPIDGSNYYVQTGDSRVPYKTNPEFDFGDTGKIAWFPQQKYDEPTSSITLASGAEMKLILAENELITNSDRSAAMTIINNLRDTVPRDETEEVDSGTGVANRSASTMEEAWGHLKRERGIELWLEARRMGDRRRWINSDAVPNAHPDQDLPKRDYCWPISQDELESNPNVDDSDNNMSAPYNY